MSLQKKCLTASAVTHSLLLLLVFVGSAFIPQKPRIDGPAFELVDIPDELVAELNVLSGGDPNAGRPAPQTPPVQQPVQQPVTPPPAPKQEPVIPKPVETVKPPVEPKEIQPEKVEPKLAEPKPVERPVEPEKFDLSTAKAIPKETPKPAKPEKEFNLAKAELRKIQPSTPTKIAPATGESRNSAKTSTKAAEALASALKAMEGTGGRVGSNPDAILGPGGKAAMSYDMAVVLIYENEFKRHPLPSRSSDPAVETEVTIRRDGTVVRKSIVRKSGRAPLDRTVQEVLDSVKRVREFPSDISTETRTIKINFKLDNFTRG